MYKFTEDREQIESFLNRCLEHILEIGRLKAENEKLQTVFTIASTTKRSLYPYVTPIRKNRYFGIAGCIVFTQSQASRVCEVIDGKVDFVVVDAEKKIPMLISPDLSILSQTAMDEKETERKSIEVVETGNLSFECYRAIVKSKFYEFKPNDLTIDAVWAYVSKKLGFLTGKKVAVVGAGNIGSKLALKFVESGMNVSLCRRNQYNGEIISHALNLIKPESTISSVVFTSNPLKACFLADVIIGCTNGDPAIQWEHIAASKKDSLIIDVGKGSITEDAISQASKAGKEIYRTDISAALDGHLITLLRNDEIISKKTGRVKIDDTLSMVSGGLLGKKNEIVVDNVNNPTYILGIADGTGDFVKHYSDDHQRLLRAAMEKIPSLKGAR